MNEVLLEVVALNTITHRSKDIGKVLFGFFEGSLDGLELEKQLWELFKGEAAAVTPAARAKADADLARKVDKFSKRGWKTGGTGNGT